MSIAVRYACIIASRFWPIRCKYVAVLPHVRVKYQNHAVLLGAVEQRLVHHAGMLNAPARVGAGVLGLRTLDRGEHHVDFAVAIGMRGNLPSGVPPLLKVLIEFFLRTRRRNAVIARPVGIRFTEPCGSAAQRISVEILDRRDAQTIVAEAALDSGSLGADRSIARRT